MIIILSIFRYIYYMTKNMTKNITKNMTNLPRLELTENPDKKSDFIIFRKSLKNKNTKKHANKKSGKKIKKKTKRNIKKGLFNLFL